MFRIRRRLIQVWPLWAGTLILAGLWLGPLPEMSRWAFSPHMILHLGVTVVAGPLVAFGLLRLRGAIARLRRPILLAFVASGAEMAVVWGWHAPPLHEAASLVPGVFVVQQASFLGAGILVWLPGFAGNSRLAYGSGVLAMLVTFTHMTMLGMLLVLAPDLIYTPALCLGAFGLEPLEDQRFGGVLMALGGGLPYLIGGLVLAHRLIPE